MFAMKQPIVFWTLALCLFVLPLAYAQNNSDVPLGLQKIIEENNKFAAEFLTKVSFLIAFLAGVTTLLSPCLLPVLPAFFAYTFKEKTQLTKMTLLFFAGFAPIFILLGIAATTAGNFFGALFKNLDFYIILAGVMLAVLGLLTFFGLSFSFSTLSPSAQRKDWVGVLLSGMLFGFGWVVCVGPILSGVLITASVFHNYWTASLLMLAYSLGVFVPLFIIAFFYDKYNLGQSKLMQGKTVEWNILGSKIELHSHQMIAGVLLMITGVVFVLFKGTNAINGWAYFGLKDYFYIIQTFFLENALMANVLGGVLLIALVLLIWKMVRKN
jgi:cytochrome c biogenesis protein CcdA